MSEDPSSVRPTPAEPSWYARHPMLTATVLGLLAGAAVAGLDLGLGSPGRDWRGSMVLPAGLLTVSVLLTLARVRRDPRLTADRLGLVLAAVIGVAFVVVGVSVIPGSTTVPRVLNGGLVVLLGLVLAVSAGIRAVRPAAADAALIPLEADAAADPPTGEAAARPLTGDVAARPLAAEAAARPLTGEQAAAGTPDRWTESPGRKAGRRDPRDGEIAYPSRPINRGRRGDPPTGPTAAGR